MNAWTIKSIHWKELQNNDPASSARVQSVISKYRFHWKEQADLGASCRTREQGSYHDYNSIQDSEAHLEKLP